LLLTILVGIMAVANTITLILAVHRLRV